MFYLRVGLKFYDKPDIITLFEYFSDIPARAGLSKLTGMNQGLIRRYANGIRQAGSKKVARIEAAIHEFARDLT